jgi:hypothetical protein
MAAQGGSGTDHSGSACVNQVQEQKEPLYESRFHSIIYRDVMEGQPTRLNEQGSIQLTSLIQLFYKNSSCQEMHEIS